MTIGIGLFNTNKNRIKSFEIDFNNNPAVFFINESNRIEHTLKEYKNVFIIIPIIMIAALLILLNMANRMYNANSSDDSYSNY